MLKLAKSVEYAIFALKYIAENPHSDCISTKEISEKMNIPYDLLAKILQRLVKDGIIISVQGTKGGYSLSINPGELTVTRIIKRKWYYFHEALTVHCSTPSKEPRYSGEG